MTERPDSADDTLLVLLCNQRLPLATLCAALGINEAKARRYLQRVREGKEGEDAALGQPGSALRECLVPVLGPVRLYAGEGEDEVD